MAKIPEEHDVIAVCKPGQDNICCRYLAMGPDGWSCEKFSSLKDALDYRALHGKMVARGDNCTGYK